ncbi:MAG: hypothetical protein DVB25_04570 [Verrucomicrobia bacterium]|nr:MAG: hypothetical protein DVB25_04570 [Verrucomicrobiota bacterium]
MQSNPPNSTHLEPVLRRLRQRIRRVRASRGALITAVTALAGLLALVANDWAFAPLPTWARWLCPFAWLALVTSVAAIWWVLPLRQPLDLVRIARWLEIRHPELDERISTVLEVSGHHSGGMSAGLLDALAREAATDLIKIDPLLEVSARRARYWLWPAAALLAVVAVLLALSPSLFVRHLVRALVPTSTLGTVGSMVITPGSLEVIAGDALTITARDTSGATTPLELVLHLADGSTSVLAMEALETSWVYKMGKAGLSFKYELRAGRETSDIYQITVWPRPQLADTRVRLEFPAYTGWAAREQPLGDGIIALTGTKLALRAKLNTPVEAARLEVDEHAVGTATLEPAADGGGLAARWTLEKPGHAATRVMLKHRLGREFEAARFAVQSRPDAPPEVKWLSATDKELHLRPDDLVEARYSVNDDIGLGSVPVQLEVLPDNGNAACLPLVAPLRKGTTEPPAWRGRVEQPVGALVARWPQAHIFKLRVRAEDNRPANLGGPGVGSSGWLTLRLDDGAQSSARQEVAAVQADVRETIEQVRQTVQQAQEKIDRRRPEMQNETLTPEATKELADARDQLAQAHDKLEDLAARLPESIHGDKAPEVRQAAATVEQARQQLENAPLQDTPKERDQSAAAARDTAVKAEQQLDKLRDEIQRSEPQAQDFAHLKELEQQQAEVARQADAALAKNPPDPTQPDKPDKPPEPWQQKQANVAEAIRQDAQQQPQAQAAALAHQAEEAKRLATEAKQQAAAQDALKQLDANLPKPPDPPVAQPPAQPDPAAAAAAKQAIHNELTKEQTAIASEAAKELAAARQRQDNPTANALPAAIEAAQHASDALAHQDDPAAAADAKQAASQLADAAKAAAAMPESSASPTSPTDPASQANLSHSPTAAAELAVLASRQEQVAAALTALEAGKTAEAAADLAALRAQESAALAEEIRTTPQVNGPSGPMQQAVQATQQAAAQAKQAAQTEAQGKSAEAAASHAQAAQQLEQAAAQLAQAAAEFSQQAAQAAARQPGPQQAPTPGQPLADAFQQASEAATSKSPAAAASEAHAAAQALAKAADATLQAMQSPAPGAPGQPPPPNQPGQPTPPGSVPDDSLRNPEADPGVPPELAKLGVSAADWEKIKASLKSDVGGASSITLPEEYRDLVRRYFEQISKSGPP